MKELEKAFDSLRELYAATMRGPVKWRVIVIDRGEDHKPHAVAEMIHPLTGETETGSRAWPGDTIEVSTNFSMERRTRRDTLVDLKKTRLLGKVEWSKRGDKVHVYGYKGNDKWYQVDKLAPGERGEYVTEAP